MTTRAYTRDPEYGSPAEQQVGFSTSSSCKYLDILQYGRLGEKIYDEKNGNLDDASLKSWITEDVTTTIKIDPQTKRLNFSGGLRLIFGTCDYEPNSISRLLPFTKEIFELLKQRFRLPEKFLDSMASRASASFKSAHERSGFKKEFQPHTCFVFKMGILRPSYYYMAVSWDRETNLTYVLLLAKTNIGHDFLSICSHLQNLKQHSSHPFLLPLIITELCFTSTARRIDEGEAMLGEVEETMGQHEYINRPVGDPLKIDFLSVTRKLNFHGRTLNVEKMRAESMLLTLSMMKEEYGLLEEIPWSSEYIKELMDYHTSAYRYLLLRADFRDKQVQALINTVFQLMAQKDSKVNIQLAETSTSIAIETKKDSSAMKVIAGLTMFFLPGTFTAAIFAMPLFNWDGGDLPIVKNQFKYYWAIAIPLTIMVIIIWLLFLLLPWRRWFGRLKVDPKRGDLEARKVD